MKKFISAICVFALFSLSLPGYAKDKAKFYVTNNSQETLEIVVHSEFHSSGEKSITPGKQEENFANLTAGKKFSFYLAAEKQKGCNVGKFYVPKSSNGSDPTVHFIVTENDFTVTGDFEDYSGEYKSNNSDDCNPNQLE